MLHALFYVSAAGSFDKLIDTEGGAQQDRLDGGAQLLPLGLAASLGERVRLGAPVQPHRPGAAPAFASSPTAVEVEAERAIVAAAARDRGADRVRPAAAAGPPACSPSACCPAP